MFVGRRRLGVRTQFLSIDMFLCSVAVFRRRQNILCTYTIYEKETEKAKKNQKQTANDWKFSYAAKNPKSRQFIFLAPLKCAPQPTPTFEGELKMCQNQYYFHSECAMRRYAVWSNHNTRILNGFAINFFDAFSYFRSKKLDTKSCRELIMIINVPWKNESFSVDNKIFRSLQFLINCHSIGDKKQRKKLFFSNSREKNWFSDKFWTNFFLFDSFWERITSMAMVVNIDFVRLTQKLWNEFNLFALIFVSSVNFYEWQ